MATHRSLNKLEFRAHMSIHDFTEVNEEEPSDSHFTRDRFGKVHRLSNEDGSSRIGRSTNKIMLFVMAVFLGAGFHGFAQAEPASARRGTDVHVESGGIDELLSKKDSSDTQDKLGLAVDESTSIGFNDNGDPNLAMRF